MRKKINVKAKYFKEQAFILQNFKIVKLKKKV